MQREVRAKCFLYGAPLTELLGRVYPLVSYQKQLEEVWVWGLVMCMPRERLRWQGKLR